MSQKGLSPVLIILLIAAAIGGYLIYSGKITIPQKQITQTPKSDASPAPTITDETSNWKTYSSNKHGFSVKYPEDPNLFLSQTNDNNGFQLRSYSIGLGVNTEQEVRGFMGESFPPRYEELKYFGNIPPLINKRKIIIDGVEALRADAIGKYEQDFDLDVVIFANKSSLYSFTLDRIAAKSLNTLERDKKVFDQILSTFKFQ